MGVLVRLGRAAGDGGVLAQRRLLIWAGVAAALSLLGLGWAVVRSGPPGPDLPAVPGDEPRIVVEVLNGTRVNGLARATTLRLRRQGVDVVYYGTARDSVWQTSEIIARRGDTAVARIVADLLGTGAVLDRPDSSRFLDVTVILGLDVASGREGLDP